MTSHRSSRHAEQSESTSVMAWIRILILPIIAVSSILYLALQSDGLILPPSLDFTGGTRLEYQIDESDAIAKGIETSQDKQDAISRIQELFLFRLRNFDLSEIIVKPLGDDRLLIEIPGTETIERVKNDIGNPAVLTFRLVLGDAVTNEEFGQLPSESKNNYFALEGSDAYILVSEPIFDVSGIDYKLTRMLFTEAPVKPYVLLALNPGEEDDFAQMTTEYFGELVAICLDDVVVSMARIAAKDIREPTIQGDFTEAEARDLARILRSGPMPVSLDLVVETTTSPTLGEENLRRGLIGITVGFAFFIIVFILAYADHLSMIVAAALCILLEAAFIYLFARMGWFITLNMIAVAGLIVLLGITVDNMILVFEEFRSRQLQEENLTHSQLINGVKNAFNNEASIIVRANVVGVVALLPLWLLDGPVKDLVSVMMVGTFLTLLITVWFARALLSTKEFMIPLEESSLSERRLLPVRFDLLKYNSIFLFLYILAIIISIVSFSQRGFVYGLDFKGGTEITILSTQSIGIENLREVAAEYFGERTDVRRISNSLGDSKEFEYVIWVPHSAQGDVSDNFVESNIAAEKFISVLQDAYSFDIKLSAVNLLGSTVLGLDQKLVIRYVIIGLLLMILFVGIFYGFRYFVPVLIATFFDGFIILGAISFFQVPLSIPLIGTVLTILSYSTNDSIVLCGHIAREFKDKNKEIMQRLKEMRWENKDALREIQKKPKVFAGNYIGKIMKELSLRIILTSLTTVVAAIALWIYGEGLLRDFGIIVTVGIVVGTFSSISLVAGRMKAIHSRDIYNLASELLSKIHVDPESEPIGIKRRREE